MIGTSEERRDALTPDMRPMVTLIRDRSPDHAELEREGKLKIVGAFYDLDSGRIELLAG